MIVLVPAYAVFTDELIHRNFYGCVDHLFNKLRRRNLVPVHWERDDARMIWVLFMFQYYVHPMKMEPPVGVV